MIKEIKESLEKATPAPWNREGNEVWRRGTGYNTSEDGHVWICDSFNIDNAHLIANAPEWLRYLIGEVERLERALEQIANQETQQRNYSIGFERCIEISREALERSEHK